MDDDLVRACPACDRASQITSWQGHGHRAHGEERYRCVRCGERFDEPVIRERKNSPGRSGLVAKLEKMDPDDLGGGVA